jgi:hypothetical protein
MEKQAYEAIDGKEGAQKRIFIVELGNGETLHFKYQDVHFKRVSKDRSGILIICYSFNLAMFGHRQDLVAAALDGEYAGRFRVYSPEEHAGRPTDPDKPVIDKVELYYKADEGSPHPAESLRTRH